MEQAYTSHTVWASSIILGEEGKFLLNFISSKKAQEHGWDDKTIMFFVVFAGPSLVDMKFNRKFPLLVSVDWRGKGVYKPTSK